jgi:ribosome-binding protein aMBF1 (putative translation factor)
MDCQDWTPTTITSSKATATKAAAASTARKVAPEVAHARKVEQADVPVKPKQLAPESRQEIVNKRAAMKKSQVELNQLCNFPVNTIREIEAGRLTPTIGQLNTLNRVLKTGLKMV